MIALNNDKKIVIVLSGIVTLLTIGIFSEVNYSNEVQARENNVNSIREITIRKKGENKDTVNIKDDIDEELITNETKKEIEEELKKDTYKEENNNKETTTNEVIIKESNQVVEKNIKEEQVQVSIQVPVYVSEIDKIRQSNDYLGTAGRLYIPNININVGLNYANIYDDGGYNAQDIVDRYDSAAYYTFANKLTIADHNYQGFSSISNLNWYDKAFIKRYDGSVEEYQMINKFIGHNTGIDLTDNYGNSIETMNGVLVMYTCYGDGDGIMVTLWNRVN